MNALRQSPPRVEPTLDVLWRGLARRAPGRVLAACIVVGMVSLATLLLREAPHIFPLLGLVVGCFGVYGAVSRPELGARVDDRTQAIVRWSASAGAALAGIAGGLLQLASVFGGSIEVMRR